MDMFDRFNHFMLYVFLTTETEKTIDFVDEQVSRRVEFYWKYFQPKSRFALLL